MAHPQQIDFCNRVRIKFPQYFDSASVLDIGSMDINGNNRIHFTNSQYTGIDIGEGRNVDVVCSGHIYDGGLLYDTVISTECFEHDVHWRDTIRNAYRLLKPNGLLLFTAAGYGRPEHGTSRTSPLDSPYTNEHYENITIKMLSELELEKHFYPFSVEYNGANDIYFWGIKRITIQNG